VPHQICRCQRDLNSNSISAYLPYADQIAKKLSSKDLEDGWGDSWRRVFSKQVATDTHKKVPFTPGSERFPLLIFSPGQGVPSTSYTTLLQEIVSRGTLSLRSNPLMKAQPSVFLTELSSNGDQDAGGFASLQNDGHMIGVGLLQVLQHELLAPLLLRSFDDGRTPFLNGGTGRQSR
jgi:hypothetical protein